MSAGTGTAFTDGLRKNAPIECLLLVGMVEVGGVLGLARASSSNSATRLRGSSGCRRIGRVAKDLEPGMCRSGEGGATSEGRGWPRAMLCADGALDMRNRVRKVRRLPAGLSSTERRRSSVDSTTRMRAGGWGIPGEGSDGDSGGSGGAGLSGTFRMLGQPTLMVGAAGTPLATAK